MSKMAGVLSRLHVHPNRYSFFWHISVHLAVADTKAFAIFTECV